VLGEKTIDDYAEDANDNFIDRYPYAATYLIQTVESQWLILHATHKTPPKMWTALEDKFARENTSSFFDQLNAVFDTKYDILDLLSDHINKYDTLWNRLHLRCSTASSTDRYTLRFVFQNVFESPEAKAAILLHSLPESMNYIVDNLQTKEDLTYHHVYNKLMDLKIPTAVNSADNKVYKSADVKGKGKELRREPSRKGPKALPKECSYCKKHYPTARSDGHTWNECVKLKAANLKNKEKRTAKSAKEETPEPVSTLSSVRTTTKISSYPRWVIDTGASSHMTNNLDLFINFETVKGAVMLDDDSVIETCGRGTVVILAKTSIGHVSFVYLERVLWVPSLGSCSWLSWRAIVSLGKGFSLASSGKDMYIFRENKTEVFWGKLDGQDYVVQEEKESAKKMTYKQWHEALGYPSPDYLKSTNHSDAMNLPKVPKDWQCETCITSKSTKRKPASITDIRSDTPFELIHSDLSGKFSKTSLGKSNYYVTFIDDCTRYAWIYPIHAKTDTVTVFTSFLYARYTQDNAIIKRFRADNGGEYVNAAMLTLLDNQGIVYDFSPAYSHESNGIAERYNRTIITAACSLLTGLPIALWAEAIATAVYLQNRLPN